jgi:hypothetical protein
MKTVSRTTKVTIVAMLATMLFATDAFAAGYNVGTRLSIKAPHHVQKGHAFTIDGFLRSSKHFCRADSKIELVKVGGGVVAHDRTTARGHYAFRHTIHRTTKFFTKFDGKAKGVHPNIRVCRKSSSRKRTVHAH